MSTVAFGADRTAGANLFWHFEASGSDATRTFQRHNGHRSVADNNPVFRKSTSFAMSMVDQQNCEIVRLKTIRTFALQGRPACPCAKQKVLVELGNVATSALWLLPRQLQNTKILCSDLWIHLCLTRGDSVVRKLPDGADLMLRLLSTRSQKRGAIGQIYGTCQGGGAKGRQAPQSETYATQLH